MAEGFGCVSGGIFGLLDLLEAHPEEVEYDLISHGLRLRQLGTPLLSWRDLYVIVRQQPSDAALARAMDPEGSAWGLSEQLLAAIADASHVRVWQAGSGKKSDRPKPIPRPGVESGSKQIYKHEVLPAGEMASWLGGDFLELLPA